MTDIFSPNVSPGGVLPYNPTEGVPLPVLPLDDRTALATFTVAQLLELVPDPIASENPKLVGTDARLKEYADLRMLVQRAVEGAKAKNARNYGEYLIEGTQGHRPWMVPAVTLFTPEHLKLVTFPGGMNALILPWGNYLVSIDGETQRLAWGNAVKAMPALRTRKVAIILHHGKTVEEARQGFHDLNTKEVKPNAAVAISMDTLDPATKMARDLAESSELLRSKVNMRRRQLRRNDSDLMTMSGLRTAIVTTILGPRGLQAGARSISEMIPEGTDLDAVQEAVLEVWSAMLDVLEDALSPENRANTVVSAPSVLAGLGCLAHQAMPKPPRSQDEQWEIDDVIAKLDGVIWDRQLVLHADAAPIFPWEGVCGKVTPKGTFSIGGPKEVGYTVAKALEDPESEEGKRIRGGDLKGPKAQVRLGRPAN